MVDDCTNLNGSVGVTSGRSSGTLWGETRACSTRVYKRLFPVACEGPTSAAHLHEVPPHRRRLFLEMSSLPFSQVCASLRLRSARARCH